MGELKEMITKGHIRVRRPYGYTNESYLRRASFTGSVNKAEFLNDPTGSRRFLCFTVEEIDYKLKVDLDKVYSQAYRLFMDGEFKYWFDKDEISAINQNNDQYGIATIEEELITTYFEPCNGQESCLLLTATEIAKIIGQDNKLGLSNALTQNVGKVMHKLNFERVKSSKVYKYKVLKRNRAA